MLGAPGGAYCGRGERGYEDVRGRHWKRTLRTQHLELLRSMSKQNVEFARPLGEGSRKKSR